MPDVSKSLEDKNLSKRLANRSSCSTAKTGSGKPRSSPKTAILTATPWGSAPSIAGRSGPVARQFALCRQMIRPCTPCKATPSKSLYGPMARGPGSLAHL